MKKQRKKRPLTLLEIMIVIFLIGLIGSVIGVNMKGSMDEGRAFKTSQAMEQITDILMLEVARGTPIAEVVEKKKQVLENSGLVKNADKLLKDGWNQEFAIKVDERSNDRIIITSEKYKAYKAKKREKMGKTDNADDQEE